MRKKMIKILAFLYVMKTKMKAKRKEWIKKTAYAAAKWYISNVQNKEHSFLKSFLVAMVIVAIIVAGTVGIVLKLSKGNKNDLDNYVKEAPMEQIIDLPSPSDYADNSDWEYAVNRLEQDAADGFWYGKLYVDLVSLREINEDIIGWIYFEAEDINYPILYSGDNAKYIKTAYNMETDAKGSIFLDGENSFDFSDRHSLIYGHNMKDLSMFGQLKYYKEDEDYFLNHQYFQIILLDAETGDLIKQRYHIFSCRDAKKDDEAYTVYNKDYKSLDTFAENVLKENNYLEKDVSIPIESDDYVVTLSTCAEDGERIMVSAVRESVCRISNRN